MRLNSVPITHGSVLRTAHLGGISLTETLHPPSLSLPVHGHDRAAITLVLQGGFTEQIGNRPYCCRPISVLFKPAGTEHGDVYGQANTRSFIIELDATQIAAHAEFGHCGRHAKLSNGGLPAARALRLYDAFRRDDPMLLLHADALYLDLFEYDFRPGDRRQPAWLECVRELIGTRLDSPPRLAELAHEAGVHPVYLARAFRRHYGCSISSLIHRLRADSAATALAQGSEPLSSLALRLGFSDQSHLTRVFRRETQWSPGRFRRLVRRLDDPLLHAEKVRTVQDRRPLAH